MCELIFDDDVFKLYKILVDVGFGLCCDMEDLILQGCVFVNGLLVYIGQCIFVIDQVCVNGKLIQCKFFNKLLCVFLYYKLVGEIVSQFDLEGCLIVFDVLLCMKIGKWVVVGCLDFNIEGLLIFMIFGDIVNWFMYLCYGVECEYVVCMFGELVEIDC